VVALMLSTTISCSQAIGILNKLTNVVSLTAQQKIDIVIELKKYIPSCPVVIESPKLLNSKK